MKLIFKGKVELGDDCRVGLAEEDGAIRIGDKDVVREIDDTFSSDTKLTVGIADKTFTGELFVMCGWGYSEYTPMDSDELKVGEHNLISILQEHEDEEVTMFVSDEPIDVLED
ncbi:hypothetical protein Pryu01_03017 [Paraliobacillus ryukyuensis]|uniref:Uncharacterized protein n=2 Tax=Paraliobacillus ryukyuensis TaxID=200904 RepID=A0A366DPM2_9BACI|nr:hypothetical protein DES48_11715 [Paraliobacillus ryukyuensis]